MPDQVLRVATVEPADVPTRLAAIQPAGVVVAEPAEAKSPSEAAYGPLR